MKLALALGQPLHVVESWPAAEVALWQAFDSIEPFGAVRHDLGHAIVAAVSANAAGGKKNGEAFSPRDFMPDFDPAPPKRQTPEEIRQRFMGLVT